MTTTDDQDDNCTSVRNTAGIGEPIQEEDDDEQEPIEFDLKDQDIESSNKLAILRDLLAIERKRNLQRRANNQALHNYLGQLQTDYLRLQRELLEALDLGHKIAEQKNAQLENMKLTLDEKERLIGKLREKLEDLDAQHLRDEFKILLNKQTELAELERDQLRQQIVSLEQQLVRERVNSSQLLQQLQTKIEEHMSDKEKIEKEMANLLNEPKNVVLRTLREEKCQLENQLDEMSTLLDQSSFKFDRLQKRMESLLEEQEQMDKRNEEELGKMSEALKVAEQRVIEAKLETEDKQETEQILQFNLQRSERRVKNLLNTLKGKEIAYKELISSMEVRHEEELEKLAVSLKANERKVVELSTDLDTKQNDIKRIQLELETRLESLRNDRDSRIDKSNQEKQKIERSMRLAEIKIAQLIEELDRKNDLIAHHQKEATNFREEAKRLSIELTKNEAIMYSKQKELNELMLNMSNHSSKQLEDKCCELQELERHAKRQEQVANELRCDNEKLSIRLRMTEQKLSQIGSAINKEQSKMVFNYEKKMQQIREEQNVFDRNKLRYKRYGYKLKKYCEHLRRVHEHLCNPSLCGYTIIPTKPSREFTVKPDQTNSHTSEDESATGDNERALRSCCEKENFVASEDAINNRTRRRSKFSIKRTGSGVSLRSRRSALSVLKSAQSLNNPLYRDSPINISAEHNYYSIDEATM